MNDPRILDHEYDGIQEFDNPTPVWWHLLFLASIVFAMVYANYWHGNPGAPTVQETWRQAQVAEYKRIFGAIGDLNADEPTVQKMMADQQMMAVAQGLFITNCAACHARDGGGLVGPNLADDNYKNVKRLLDVYTTITKGAANGAMPTWEQRLSQNERVLLAAYAASLRGTSPGAPKSPEGDPIPPWPTAPSK